MHNFTLNKSPKSLVDFKDTTWKPNETPKKVEREREENRGGYEFCFQRVCGGMQLPIVSLCQRSFNAK